MQTDTQTVKQNTKLKHENNIVKDNCKDKKVRCKTLIIHGGRYRTTFTRKFESRKTWIKPDENQIQSYIPGNIKELFVREGDIVKKGDRLLILEAMKMYNTINSPKDALISKIHVRVGDNIPKGRVILEFV